MEERLSIVIISNKKTSKGIGTTSKKRNHLATVSSTVTWWFNSLVRSSKGLKPQWLLAPRYSSNKI